MTVLVVALHEPDIDKLMELNWPFLVSLIKQVSKVYQFQITAGLMGNPFASDSVGKQIDRSFPVSFGEEDEEDTSGMPKLNDFGVITALLQNQ